MPKIYLNLHPKISLLIQVILLIGKRDLAINVKPLFKAPRIPLLASYRKVILLLCHVNEFMIRAIFYFLGPLF